MGFATIGDHPVNDVKPIAAVAANGQESLYSIMYVASEEQRTEG
jgi:hypothetical protein